MMMRRGAVAGLSVLALVAMSGAEAQARTERERPKRTLSKKYPDIIIETGESFIMPTSTAELVALVEVEAEPGVFDRLKVAKVWMGSIKAGTSIKVETGRLCFGYDAGKRWQMALSRERGGYVCERLWPASSETYWGYADSLLSMNYHTELDLERRWSKGAARQLAQAKAQAKALEEALKAEVGERLRERGCEGDEGHLLLWPDGRREFSYYGGVWQEERRGGRSKLVLSAKHGGAARDAQALCLKESFDASYRGLSFKGRPLIMTMGQGGPQLALCFSACEEPKMSLPQLPRTYPGVKKRSVAWRCSYEGPEVLQDAQALVYCGARWRDAALIKKNEERLYWERRGTGVLLAAALASWPQDTVESLRAALATQGLALEPREVMWLLSSEGMPQLLQISPWRLHAQALLLMQRDRGVDALVRLGIARAIAGTQERRYDPLIERLERTLTKEEVAQAAAQIESWRDEQPDGEPVLVDDRAEDFEDEDLAAPEPPELEAQAPIAIPLSDEERERRWRDGLLLAIAAAVVVLTGLLIKRSGRR